MKAAFCQREGERLYALCAGRGGDLWDFQHRGGSVFREQALPDQPTDLDKETAAPQMHYKLRKV